MSLITIILGLAIFAAGLNLLVLRLLTLNIDDARRDDAKRDFSGSAFHLEDDMILGKTSLTQPFS